MCIVGVCGHFGGTETFLDGQTVKTKVVTKELMKAYGDQDVCTVDTYGGAKKTPVHLFRLFRLTAKCKNIIILPAHNSLRIFVPYLLLLNRIYRRKLHYIVIGGWLPKLLSSHSGLASQLKKLDVIYVETSAMMHRLQDMGFTNVVLMKNCKDLDALSPELVRRKFDEPYPLCTFSRVNAEKGIGEAVEAVQKVNAALGRTVYSLDIYGQIENQYASRFGQLQKEFPPYIRYCGAIPFDRSTEVLKDYFALLFPTHYYTEGIPGTFIDAYAAGVPVIFSRWENYKDVVDDGITGLGFDFEQYDQLEQILTDCAACPEKLLDMRTACIKKEGDFLPENALRILQSHLD